MERIKKENYYLNIAETVASRSTCIRRRYGAIIVKNDEVIATGYNGAPRGEENCCECGFCQREALGIPKGERYELCVSVHAEANAIISASRQEMLGSTIYIVGFEVDGTRANSSPCLMCRRLIRNAGITKCVGYVNGVPTEISLEKPETPKPVKSKPYTREGADARLDGGYVAVTTYANLSDDDASRFANENEEPTAVLAVRENFLELYVLWKGWNSVDEFLKEYTYDAITDLEDLARENHALAFTCCALLGDRAFRFFRCSSDSPGNEAKAYADFLSGMPAKQI